MKGRRDFIASVLGSLGLSALMRRREKPEDVVVLSKASARTITLPTPHLAKGTTFVITSNGSNWVEVDYSVVDMREMWP